jgi:cobalt/nickel transport system permease protein
MHIPDGFIPLTFAIPAFLITIVFWIISFKKIKLTEQQVPMMGLLTALFFAAMFINIPVAGGATAHILGGAALGLILGPFAGLISMSIILVLQAFLFGDGGLITLGANVLNLGVIGVFVPCIIFIILNKLLKPKTDNRLYLTIFISTLLGALSAAMTTGIQVGLSPLSPYGLYIILPSMFANHFVIGIIEGILTVILLMTLLKLRPDVLEKSPMLGRLSLFKDNNEVKDEKFLLTKNKRLNKKTVIIGLSMAIFFVILGVFFFSYAIETLDLKAAELGIVEQPVYDPLFPDYNFSGFENKWSNLLIGIASTFLLFVAAFAIAKLISKKRKRQRMRIPHSLRDLLNSAETIAHIEDLSDKNGLMQAIHPIAKLVVIAAMIISALFITSVPYLLIICLIPIIFAIASHISLKQLLTRTALIPLFMAAVSIPLLFITTGHPIWTAHVGSITLTVTVEGVTKFLLFTTRIWFCIATLSLLILSTGFDKTLKLLATLRVPSLIIQLFSLTYRYFFVSIHEAQSMLIAKEARTYIHKKTINLQTLKNLGTTISSLFIRTYERSERVYLAMKARGFDISKNNNSNNTKTSPLHAHDIVFTLSIIIAFTCFALL